MHPGTSAEISETCVQVNHRPSSMADDAGLPNGEGQSQRRGPPAKEQSPSALPLLQERDA